MHRAVSGNDLLVCGSQIYNHYRDCKDANSYLSADRINDVIALSADKVQFHLTVINSHESLSHVI